MENNLNKKVIRRYSREFAEKVCNDYFANSRQVDNDALMEVQPVKQVNLFVVKNLFDQWQQESEQLKSPYFNYAAPKVVEAMDRLKNVLSRHILLDRDTYEPLLARSAEETLRLILSPYDYYKDLISIDEALLTTDYLRATSRYMKVNPFIIQELINRLEQENITDPDHEKVRLMLDQVVESLDKEPDDVEPHIEAFGQVHPLSLEELFGSEKGR